ncbi:MAG: alpha/beta hydrolase [bacterium]|nr:alpha/beta hydrolase [bacterium]MXV89892.1 alpha/beta hydrolase [Acidimicrobiia bacterium]MYC45908.1 alpha/beta hydrolase [Acidimicrobiia bacterium]MYI20019.1 alpha/beta hydrolase [Acidimicrobiia bacterium]
MTDRSRPPEPLRTSEVRLGDGAVTVLRRHGNPDGPRLVLSCGLGFAADLYWPFWSLLAEDFDLVVYDLRSHGWNPVTPLRIHNLPTLVDDNRRVLDAVSAGFGAKPSIGVFHSLSAMVALMHEQQAPAFAALVLFDPPICPPGADLDDMETVCQGLSSRARRRQRHFESPQELVTLLGEASGFSLVPPETRELFAEVTLRPAVGGRYELRCPPEHEGQLYEWYFGFSMQAPEILDGIGIPVKVIGADPTVAFSFLPSMDLSTLTVLDYDFVPDTTHLLQLEAPHRCVELTRQFLQAQGLSHSGAG